jgi:hypothetical protein
MALFDGLSYFLDHHLKYIAALVVYPTFSPITPLEPERTVICLEENTPVNVPAPWVSTILAE